MLKVEHLDRLFRGLLSLLLLFLRLLTQKLLLSLYFSLNFGRISYWEVLFDLLHALLDGDWGNCDVAVVLSDQNLDFSLSEAVVVGISSCVRFN